MIGSLIIEILSSPISFFPNKYQQLLRLTPSHLFWLFCPITDSIFVHGAVSCHFFFFFFPVIKFSLGWLIFFSLLIPMPSWCYLVCWFFFFVLLRLCCSTIIVPMFSRLAKFNHLKLRICVWFGTRTNIRCLNNLLCVYLWKLLWTLNTAEQFFPISPDPHMLIHLVLFLCSLNLSLSPLFSICSNTNRFFFLFLNCLIFHDAKTFPSLN